MEFWAGILGVVVGGVLQFASARLNHWWNTKQERDYDAKLKDLLRQSLEAMPVGVEWRKLTTLCGIIGAPPEKTTRLLIELGARGSETEAGVWALAEKKPLRGS